MSAITLTLASISYESFIKQYLRHIGLSGTIGTEEERKELKEIFNLNSFDVPRFEGNAFDAKLKIIPPIIVQGYLFIYLLILILKKMKMNELKKLLLLLSKHQTMGNQL